MIIFWYIFCCSIEVLVVCLSPHPVLHLDFTQMTTVEMKSFPHVYLKVKITMSKTAPCVHIAKLVHTFPDERMPLITRNIDFVCNQCWKRKTLRISFSGFDNEKYSSNTYVKTRVCKLGIVWKWFIFRLNYKQSTPIFNQAI